MLIPFHLLNRERFNSLANQFWMRKLKRPSSIWNFRLVMVLHVLFYQSYWEYVGSSVCDWIKRIFSKEVIDPDLNNSLIVFISEVKNPESFSQFRPLSLCSVLYKLVMKVITNRFKVAFSKIIGLEQAGFIAGRNIKDNIIIVQEVIHSM